LIDGAGGRFASISCPYRQNTAARVAGLRQFIASLPLVSCDAIASRDVVMA
jgi:hypothetical protein